MAAVTCGTCPKVIDAVPDGQKKRNFRVPGRKIGPGEDNYLKIE
jgi:hypothetical protein